ncbi:MAG TPA: sigma-54 dependent transcriptional regulator [candidate division Zixibacteria bacterium]|nr:sigma-54 dependent transcriptional regulator [candidate division Zixibacteria bacterium]
MPRSAKILLVDDEPRVTLILEGELLDAGYDVTATNTSAEAIELLNRERFDLLITDLSMPGQSGLAVLEAAQAQDSDIAMIMMTAHASFDSAVAAGRLGVAKYIEKPFANEALVELVGQALAARELGAAAAEAPADSRTEYTALAQGVVFGASKAAREMNDLIKKVAPTDSTVLLTGASGSGKEVAARLIHQLSPRKDKPFVAVNCAALAETLLESELFGHEKGSFTGATDQKRGKFELADGGVIFLDEIGETSGSLQTKLLRALEERTLTRVGGTAEIHCDVRVIAATNRDLKAEISRGAFREDLYFRLNVFPVHVPSLSERRADLDEFVAFFLRVNKRPSDSITTAAQEALRGHSWPGNIRELRNVIERAVILAGAEPIDREHLNLESVGVGAADSPELSLAGAEREMILQALRECGGNKTEAAHKLGITRRRLYSRLKILGIEE